MKYLKYIALIITCFHMAPLSSEPVTIEFDYRYDGSKPKDSFSITIDDGKTIEELYVHLKEELKKHNEIYPVNGMIVGMYSGSRWAKVPYIALDDDPTITIKQALQIKKEQEEALKQKGEKFYDFPADRVVLKVMNHERGGVKKAESSAHFDGKIRLRLPDNQKLVIKFNSYEGIKIKDLKQRIKYALLYDLDDSEKGKYSGLAQKVEIYSPWQRQPLDDEAVIGEISDSNYPGSSYGFLSVNEPFPAGYILEKELWNTGSYGVLSPISTIVDDLNTMERIVNSLDEDGDKYIRQLVTTHCSLSHLLKNIDPSKFPLIDTEYPQGSRDAFMQNARSTFEKLGENIKAIIAKGGEKKDVDAFKKKLREHIFYNIGMSESGQNRDVSHMGGLVEYFDLPPAFPRDRSVSRLSKSLDAYEYYKALDLLPTAETPSKLHGMRANELKNKIDKNLSKCQTALEKAKQEAAINDSVNNQREQEVVNLLKEFDTQIAQAEEQLTKEGIIAPKLKLEVAQLRNEIELARHRDIVKDPAEIIAKIDAEIAKELETAKSRNDLDRLMRRPNVRSMEEITTEIELQVKEKFKKELSKTFDKTAYKKEAIASLVVKYSDAVSQKAMKKKQDEKRFRDGQIDLALGFHKIRLEGENDSYVKTGGNAQEFTQQIKDFLNKIEAIKSTDADFDANQARTECSALSTKITTARNTLVQNTTINSKQLADRYKNEIDSAMQAFKAEGGSKDAFDARVDSLKHAIDTAISAGKALDNLKSTFDDLKKEINNATTTKKTENEAAAKNSDAERKRQEAAAKRAKDEAALRKAQEDAAKAKTADEQKRAQEKLEEAQRKLAEQQELDSQPSQSFLSKHGLKIGIGAAGVALTAVLIKKYWADKNLKKAIAAAKKAFKELGAGQEFQEELWNISQKFGVPIHDLERQLETVINTVPVE